MSDKPIAVITGASSGIGAAAARALVSAGYDVVVGARRLDLLRQLTDEIGGTAIELDVTDTESVNRFAETVPAINVLINNAGGALGLEPIAEAVDEKWQRMYDTNVMGTMRLTRAFLPKLEASGAGHIVNIGSVAGYAAYSGGGGYTAVKHALAAVTETMRMELLGKPIRVTEIDPGLVETEFSIVRFDGDKDKAGRVYQGMTPLCAEDVADAIVWAVTRPPHVNIDQLVIKPLDQATVTMVHRR